MAKAPPRCYFLSLQAYFKLSTGARRKRTLAVTFHGKSFLGHAGTPPAHGARVTFTDRFSGRDEGAERDHFIDADVIQLLVKGAAHVESLVHF